MNRNEFLYKLEPLSNRISDLFFGKRCLFCGKLIYVFSKENFCNDCQKDISLFPDPVFYTDDNEMLITSGKYLKSFRKSLLNFKFFGNITAGNFHAALLSENIKKSVDTDKIDGILFVPSYRLKNGRKYNQAEVLAKRVGLLLSLPVYPYLRKKKDIKSQTSCKNSKERYKNVVGAYGLYQKYEKSVFGKTFLIIDDIVTTGSTLLECGKDIKEHGGKVFYAASAKTVFGNANNKFVLNFGDGKYEESFLKRKFKMPKNFEKFALRRLTYDRLCSKFYRK